MLFYKYIVDQQYWFISCPQIMRVFNQGSLSMAAKRSANPTQKDLLHRLTNIREKLSSLRQEEDKISHKLSHEFAQELSKYLISANAIEIDFNVLLGGMLEVITQAHKDIQKSCPELSRRVEAWQKSGQMFRQNRRQKSNVREQIYAPKNNEPPQEISSMPAGMSVSIAKEKTMHREDKNKPRAHIPGTGDSKDANPNQQ